MAADEFPCAFVLYTAFPSYRLAKAALGSLSVDQELSSLVQRSFQLVSDTTQSRVDSSELNVLRTEYRATTNRMLRVSVNGFFDSLGVVLQVMEELDVDVVNEKGVDGLEGVQGVEQGLTGTTIMGA